MSTIPNAAAVTEAMEVLFTKRQIAAVRERTAGGQKALSAIRTLMNAGIEADEAMIRRFRDIAIEVLTPRETPRRLGDTIIFRRPGTNETSAS